jgi:pyruvate,water dikinase
MGIIREALLDSGRELVEVGTLSETDDLFFLSLIELEAFAGGETRDWKALIEERRQAFEREKMRVQIPRVMLSDGHTFYQGLVTPDDSGVGILIGSPVSPGWVEGNVRVVTDPFHANLEPGEIIVCPGTDPAWTPLFLPASGLVMETGGMMTHGAIVAREYGIPAVVGVHQATSRLVTGQRIRLDGSSGQIEMLGERG